MQRVRGRNHYLMDVERRLQKSWPSHNAQPEIRHLNPFQLPTFEGEPQR